MKPKSGFALLSILVLAVLAIGVVTSVYLVQTKQIFQNRATEIASSTTSTYPGDLSNKFKETEVFKLSSPSQISQFFTTNHRVPQAGSLPSSVVFNGTSVTLTDKVGLGIPNPLKNEPFYKIEVYIKDTNQQNLISYLTPIDNWWTYTSFTNGISVGINTDETKSTYFYWHTQFKYQGQIPDSQFNFSKKALARFIKRTPGDTKLEMYITPIGTYAVVNGANFASFPNLYIGSYLFRFTSPLNWIVLNKFNPGGDPVTFRDLRIIKLDSSVSSIDEVNAHFIKKTVESGAFQNLISSQSSINGSDGFQNALWAAFIYRAYDYYFKTNNVAKVQGFVDAYLNYLPTYIDQNISRYGKENTIDINHSFINTSQWHPIAVYALTSYLRPDQPSKIQTQFAKVVDVSTAYMKSDGTFPRKIAYKGDTDGEEIFWPLSFYTGYYLNFPYDRPRSDKLLDYITFLAFLAHSDGKSIRQAYGGTVKLNYLDSSFLDFVAQYVWGTGEVDNHEFHPSLNYGQSVVSTQIFSNLLEKKGVNIPTFFYNTQKMYQVNILNNLDINTFRLKHPNPRFTDAARQNLSIQEDLYSFATDGSITDFYGLSSPSLFEDWGNAQTSYHIIENLGDYSLADQFAKNVYYGFYSGAGKLFCGHVDEGTGQKCSASTSSFYNYLFGDPLYAMLFSKRSSFSPVPSLTKICSVSLSSNSIPTSQPVTINFSGNNNGTTNPSAPVNLWLEKADFTQLPAGPGTQVTYTPPGQSTQYYYKLKTCTSGTTACSGSVTISNLTAGKYFVHCDVFAAPACSGNPACSYYSGPTNCTNISVPCSTNDHVSLTVNP